MSGAQLSFGVGRATITPPAGLWHSGFSLRDGPMEGVHDDLYATAVVLSDGTREVAIIGCDLVGLPIERGSHGTAEPSQGVVCLRANICTSGM